MKSEVLSGHNSNRPVADGEWKKYMTPFIIHADDAFLFFEFWCPPRGIRVLIHSKTAQFHLESVDYIFFSFIDTFALSTRKTPKTINCFEMGATVVDKIDTNRMPKKKRARGRKKRGKNPVQWAFGTYIRRMNRVINGKMSIRKDSINIMNDLLLNSMQRVCEEAKILCQLAGRRTLQAKDLNAAVKLIVGGRAIYRHSDLECKKALISLAISYATHWIFFVV